MVQLSTECVVRQACDIEDEEQKRGGKRRVVDEEHGRVFNKLIEQMHVTGRYLCSSPERTRKHEEHDEDAMSSEKMDEN